MLLWFPLFLLDVQDGTGGGRGGEGLRQGLEYVKECQKEFQNEPV